MLIRDDPNEATTDDAADWREQLSLKLLRRIFFAYVAAAIAIAAGTRSDNGRHELEALAILCAISAAVTGFTGWPRGVARGYLLVIPATLAAIGGYAVVGVLSGPGVCLTVTLMLAGLLCGRRAMLWLSLAAGLAVAGVGWAMVHGKIPAPNPSDIAMTNPQSWIRSLTLTFAAIGLFGGLMLAVITRIERSLALARSETLRREQAERARAEAEIRSIESRQLEIVGRLAAGIAHDFNNNLTSIMGCAELLRYEAGENHELTELVDGIMQASLRSAELTRQLLAYSRKAQMLLAPTDLHRLVDDTVSLLRRSIDPKVTVLTELSADGPVVAADRTLLESALLNLLVNACDAMPNGGTLRIRTLSTLSSLADARAKARRAVVLEVSDTGRGMEKNLLPHIFDPFFTTKPVGHGTGLGLAAVAGTIKAHGGTIDVESQLGQGTTFRVHLPCTDESPSSRPESGTVQRGTGAVLLVDDDAMVSMTAVATIKSFGYSVTHASDGKAAIELLRKAPQHYRLVLLDLRMPGLSGEETFDALRALNPELRVLIWSGYGADQDVAAMLRRGAAGFVQKPYRVAELSRAIADALAK
ncbi:MAG TPA: ATP-binding protein [Polyangiaceae bacterium]|nr:ATP-binding protein [Polyangiaceae bacterium]